MSPVYPPAGEGNRDRVHYQKIGDEYISFLLIGAIKEPLSTEFFRS